MCSIFSSLISKLNGTDPPFRDGQRGRIKTETEVNVIRVTDLQVITDGPLTLLETLKSRTLMRFSLRRLRFTNYDRLPLEKLPYRCVKIISSKPLGFIGKRGKVTLNLKTEGHHGVRILTHIVHSFPITKTQGKRPN